MKLTVSKFAEIADTSIRTLRHYRQLGILVPREKNEKQQNIYTTREFERFHHIKLLQSLGLSLKEIKEKVDEPKYSFEEMIDVQEEILRQKRDTIESSLEMIARIKSIKDQGQETDAEIFLLLMNSMLLENEQKEIFMDYYSKEAVDHLFPADKSKQKELDRLTRDILSVVHEALIHEYAPDHPQVQQQLRELKLHTYVKGWEIEDRKADELNERLQPYIAALPERIIGFLTEAVEIAAEETGREEA
ncbi:MerR family transcriptional regulator [Alkalicoccus urumqiensis]|nr:MerR family transcriptional regulator [Alkalicoccus urumqiensis]